MADDLDMLIAEAEIGEEARKFLASDLGRAVLGIAEQEVAKYEKLLAKHDATDSKGITLLQVKIAQYEEFPNWLNELLTNGENALSAYQHAKTGE